MFTLNGCVRVSRFVGVVVDDMQQHLKGYLCEYESYSMANILQENYEAGKELSRSRLSKWARQIVEGVGFIHEKGLVTGALHWTYLSVDRSDNAMITRIPGIFPSLSQSTQLSSGWIAPELREQPIGSKSYVISTPESNIFQLGLLLYVISDWDILFPANTNIIPQWSVKWCNRAYGCVKDGLHCHVHNDPIGLPPCEPSVPFGYQKAIALCRSGEPADRPSCSSLLGILDNIEAETLGTITRPAKKTVVSNGTQDTSFSRPTGFPDVYWVSHDSEYHRRILNALHESCNSWLDTCPWITY